MLCGAFGDNVEKSLINNGGSFAVVKISTHYAATSPQATPLAHCDMARAGTTSPHHPQPYYDDDYLIEKER